MSADKEKETLFLLILYRVCKKYLGKGGQSHPSPVLGFSKLRRPNYFDGVPKIEQNILFGWLTSLPSPYLGYTSCGEATFPFM